MKILKVLFVVSLLNFLIFLLLSLRPVKPTQPSNRQTSLKIVTVSPTPTIILKSSGMTTPTPIINNKLTVTSPTPDTRCLITIDGKKYDISVFRNTHSGGDIFKCGQDMTSVFNQQHPDSYLSNLQIYLVQ